MSHLTALVRELRGPRKRKPVPYAHLTRLQLIARMEAAERRCEVAAAKANDAARDLRKLAAVTDESGPLVRVLRSALLDLSNRAYEARDAAQGSTPLRNSGGVV